MRIIAFITDGPAVRNILAHLGEPTAPPRIAPASGPPLWAATDAEHDPAADPLLQSAPAFEFDQRIAWQPPPSLLTRVRRRVGSCLPPPARARPLWRQRPPERATTSVRSSPWPPKMDA